MVTKVEIACFEQFRLLSQCIFKSRLLQIRQNASTSGKGLIGPFLEKTNIVDSTLRKVSTCSSRNWNLGPLV